MYEIVQKKLALQKLWSQLKKPNKMYRQNIPNQTTLRVNSSYEGETIEQKVRRIVEQKTPITDGAPEIWATESEGVHPLYDMTTDRFDLGLTAASNTEKARIARNTATPAAPTAGEQAPTDSNKSV